MHILEKISEFVGKWMAVVVLVIAALSLFLPKATLWIELSWVNYLLMVVMFGMGLTLKLSDFALVFARPKEITIGCAAQFIVMPALAFLQPSWRASFSWEPARAELPATSLPISQKVTWRSPWA